MQWHSMSACVTCWVALSVYFRFFGKHGRGKLVRPTFAGSCLKEILLSPSLFMTFRSRLWILWLFCRELFIGLLKTIWSQNLFTKKNFARTADSAKKFVQQEQ